MNEQQQYITTQEDLDEIKETIEDVVQYLCDSNTISGEFVWSVIECLAIAKQAQLKGTVD